MGRRRESDGLSLWYRIGYVFRYAILHVFGPPQLGGSADPHVRLRRERAARIAAARAAREAREVR